MKVLTVGGKTQGLAAWAREMGLSPRTLQIRFAQGAENVLATRIFPSERLYPESEWMARNLEALKQAPDPEAYLRGVAMAHGEERAESLRRRWER